MKKDKLTDAFTEDQLNTMMKLGFLPQGEKNLNLFYLTESYNDYDQVYRENNIYYYDMYLDEELVEVKKFMTFDTLKEFCLKKVNIL